MSRYNIRLKILLSWCVAVCSAALQTACVDEIPGYGLNDIPEGEVTVDLQAAFTPFTESILSRTATIPGKAMADISDLCLLAYGTNGRLLDNEYFPDGVMQIDFNPSDVKDEPREDHDASNGDTAEASTKCLKKTLTLPTGRYYLIAVANLGQYTRNEDGSVSVISSTGDALKAGGRYAGMYDTLDELRAMTVGWDLENDANNREMLGFFTGSKDNVPSHTSSFTPVTVNSAGLTLHTWLRRCASKVTIDFDGSELRENVRVYLKEARIYDIPKECTLGFGLKSDSEGGNYNNAAGKDGIYTASESRLTNAIIYGEGDDHKLWPAITKGTPYGAYIEDGRKSADYDYSRLHSETADALFFYENMQGDAPRDKFQIADLENGGVQGADDIKDGIPYGTYIEVVGHYYSTANGAVSEGDIKYRFMLGKDVKRNCDAERNYHYKLTLRLRGNANDYDWHIDYKDSKPFDIPNPWYVSYLYNHDANMPFKYTPKEGCTVDSIVAEITENPWYPANGEIPDGEPGAAYTWIENRDHGNGFLSLRETDSLTVTPTMAGFPNVDNNGEFDYFNSDTYVNMNHDYYYGTGNSTSKVNRSRRTYYFDGNDHPGDNNFGREAYSYQKDGNKINYTIPLFTRAKVLVKQTGYTGNNPFVGYERHAKMRLTVYYTDKNGNVGTDSDTTTVRQVRRIVNPKGVYRDAGNNQNFNVTLMRLPGDDADEFETFDSDGPWMAEIIGDKNFITLDGKQIVTGATKTPISFQIRFNKMNTSTTETKNAVVRVRYHNYTCIHLIFVRQGYAAQSISPTGTNLNGSEQPSAIWSTFNMIAKNVPATDPRDEGSMFKYGNEDDAIDASCNVYTNNGQYLGTPKLGFPSDNEFRTPPAIYVVESIDDNGKVKTKAKNWEDIDCYSTAFDMNVATARDFEQLYRTNNIQFGYGVLYADGATTTKTKLNDAYGWWRDEGDDTKGMRGMFAYYWDRNNPDDPYNARNVFFPIGRSGYGHRKHTKGADVAGTLRYSCNRDSYFENFKRVAPLFCGLYRRPGALYWAKNTESEWLAWDGKTEKVNASNTSLLYFGLDVNYFSFDVNYITGTNVRNGADACFIRCVK